MARCAPDAVNMAVTEDIRSAIQMGKDKATAQMNHAGDISKEVPKYWEKTLTVSMGVHVSQKGLSMLGQVVQEYL